MWKRGRKLRGESIVILFFTLCSCESRGKISGKKHFLIQNMKLPTFINVSKKKKKLNKKQVICELIRKKTLEKIVNKNSKNGNSECFILFFKIFNLQQKF